MNKKLSEYFWSGFTLGIIYGIICVSVLVGIYFISKI